MFFDWFRKKEKRIEIETEKNLISTHLYKRHGKTFQFFCDAAKAAGTHGVNINYCVKLLTEEGFVVIMDNRQLGIEEMGKDDTNEVRKEKIEEGFKVFKNFVKFF